MDLSVDVDRVREAVAGGVDTIHLRDHGATARDLYARGFLFRSLAPLIVNDRVDVALALGAFGVQLGERSLRPDAVRRIAPGLRLGRSVHGPGEPEPVDWLLLGTIYPSSSHPGRAGAGPGLIARMAGGAPIVAIGGITPENAAQVMRAGAHGVAVISAILDAPSPREAARRLADEVHRQR